MRSPRQSMVLGNIAYFTPLHDIAGFRRHTMPRLPRPTSLLALVAFTLPAPDLTAQQAAAPEPTRERLERAYADAVAACAKDYGQPLEPAVPLRIATAQELVDVVAAEQQAILRQQLPGTDDEVAKEAKSRAEAIRGLIYAKFAWQQRAVLVDAPGWRRNARDLDMPELLGDDSLRALFVHELCHAHDDRRYAWAARLAKIADQTQAVAFTAVVEGHAQLRARRICGRNGWVRGFEQMTAGIGQVSLNLMRQGEAVAMQARINSTKARFSYVEGERFVEAVLAKDPERGAERIFTNPPLDAGAVSSPGWYLDPSSRPKVLFDPEPAVDLFLAACAPSGWEVSRTTVPPRQLAPSLSLLPSEEVEALLASLRQVRVGQATAPTRDGQVVLVVFEFADDEAATRWIDAVRRLGVKKDAAMKTGTERIVASTTTELHEPDCEGLLQDRTIRTGNVDTHVASIDARRGRVVVETAMIGNPPDASTHRALALASLGKIRRLP